MKSVVSSRKISELLGLKHDDVIGMLLMIMVKNPKTHEFFIPKNIDVKITIDGVIELINFMCSISGIEDLMELIDDMTEREVG